MTLFQSRRFLLSRKEFSTTMTSEKAMDAAAIIEYFAPLHDWLREQNQGQRCGW